MMHRFFCLDFFQFFNFFNGRNCICIWRFIVNDIEHITDKVALYIFATFYNNTFISVSTAMRASITGSAGME